MDSHGQMMPWENHPKYTKWKSTPPEICREPIYSIYNWYRGPPCRGNDQLLGCVFVGYFFWPIQTNPWGFITDSFSHHWGEYVYPRLGATVRGGGWTELSSSTCIWIQMSLRTIRNGMVGCFFLVLVNFGARIDSNTIKRTIRDYLISNDVRSFGRSNDLWNVTRLRKTLLVVPPFTGGWENHGLSSAGRWWKRSCATTHLSHKGEWFKTVFMSKWVDWPGKNGDFWFSSEIQKKVPNVYGIFIYTSTNLPADVKPFMDWAQLYFKCKKNNTFGADLYIDCFCLEILKASHLGIFNHQLDDPQPEFNSGWTMTVG